MMRMCSSISQFITPEICLLPLLKFLPFSFHAHLAHHLFGFPLQIGAWPYLPEGKSTMTPLILGVACLIPSERLPRFHHLFELLTAELNGSIFNAKPGYSNSNRPLTITNTDGEAASLDAPDLDLELGIGPEEITALCAAATFTCSDKSDAMARTVFEWTRGYLKVGVRYCKRSAIFSKRDVLVDIQESTSSSAYTRRSLWIAPPKKKPDI